MWAGEYKYLVSKQHLGTIHAKVSLSHYTPFLINHTCNLKPNKLPKICNGTSPDFKTSWTFQKQLNDHKCTINFFMDISSHLFWKEMAIFYNMNVSS
jgi:hypothetical protein